MKRWGWALVWMAIIAISSSTVVNSREFTQAVATKGPVKLNPQEFQAFWGAWWWVFVKGFHVLEFLILTLLLNRALKGRTGWAALIALGWAALDEYHQTFVPARGGLVTDVLIDGIGIALACFLILRISRRRAAS